MIVYGTRIISDVSLPFEFSDTAETRSSVELSKNPPESLKHSITCGFPLFRAHGRSVYLYSDRPFDGSEAGQPWCYEVKEVARFYWRGGEQELYYELDKSADTHLLGFWLVHMVLPLYMTLEGRYEFFHAGAVEVANIPILFIAPSMGGKSTMTDYFIRQGHTLISDDKVPTLIADDSFVLTGSHPYHRPYRKFEDLGYRVSNFIHDYKPIGAFYLLERSSADSPIVIEEIFGLEKFDALLPSYLYSFSFLKPKRLTYLGSMLNRTRVFRIQVPWDTERLGEVHGAICSHIQAI